MTWKITTKKIDRISIFVSRCWHESQRMWMRVCVSITVANITWHWLIMSKPLKWQTTAKARWNQNPDTNNKQRKPYRCITTNHPQSSNQPQAYGTVCGEHLTTFFYLLLFLLVYLIKMILFASFQTIEQQQQQQTIPRTLLWIAFASSSALFFFRFHVISDPGTVRFLLTFRYSVTFEFFFCSSCWSYVILSANILFMLMQSLKCRRFSP